MRAGKLRYLISIESKTVARNAIGEAVETWVQFASAYAAIEPISGREYFSAAETQNEVSTKITLRYCPGITEEMRVNDNGTIYNIQTVINFEERNSMLTLMCSKVVPQ